MSPRRLTPEPPDPVRRTVERIAHHAGAVVRDERIRRRWTIRELADRAGVSPALVHAVEDGRPATLESYARLAHPLGLRPELELLGPERRRHAERLADAVHAAMGDLEASRIAATGAVVRLDEPYQRFRFAGRADLLAWRLDDRALLHIENRTRFPDLQDAFGSFNAKRVYLPDVLAERLGVRTWRSVTHVMAVLWSAEVLHLVRRRAASFRAVCPDPSDAFAAWWSGSTAPVGGTPSTLVLLDPAARGRQQVWLDLDQALASARPRHRGYADAAAAVESLARPDDRPVT